MTPAPARVPAYIPCPRGIALHNHTPWGHCKGSVGTYGRLEQPRMSNISIGGVQGPPQQLFPLTTMKNQGLEAQLREIEEHEARRRKQITKILRSKKQKQTTTRKGVMMRMLKEMRQSQRRQRREQQRPMFGPK